MPIIILTSLYATPVGDTMPKFDIAQECQFESGSKEEMNKCTTDETQAREQLQTNWSQFTPGEKIECSKEASAGGISSFVELQTCLEMERDVAQARAGKT
jgi:hypothetical protein